MEESTSKEKVLKKIRDALIEKTEPPYPILDLESPVYTELTDSLDVTFAQELINVAGKFVYCESEEEFIADLQTRIVENDWPVLFCLDPEIQAVFRKEGIPFEGDPAKLTEAHLGITRCEYLVARTGTVMVSSRISPGTKIVCYPEIHLVVGFASQLVPDLKDAFRGLRNRYNDDMPSMITLITGPSRSAIIENQEVTGIHGPKEIYVFMIDDSIPSHPL
jgi:L-lactate dehydrogenase complex protein LldG